ncbi:hypothetical protein E1301_Tti005992 [Triplophysa tibetana]|uniref:Uncharacterized protein n=1 Tax=Triplophysa tibetana TaxID=1572043 RepID=A0A5A9PST1_9TELE|nr:hypothetical protein E1301_Tti005992 [Triplophysa tibetana]
MKANGEHEREKTSSPLLSSEELPAVLPVQGLCKRTGAFEVVMAVNCPTLNPAKHILYSIYTNLSSCHQWDILDEADTTSKPKLGEGVGNQSTKSLTVSHEHGLMNCKDDLKISEAFLHVANVPLYGSAYLICSALSCELVLLPEQLSTSKFTTLHTSQHRQKIE